MDKMIKLVPKLSNALDQKLLAAAEFDKAIECQQLIAEGALVNCRDAQGRTPLMLAMSAEGSEAAKELLTLGADANLQDFSEQTALWFAIQNGSLEKAKILLMHGASIHSCNNQGESVLALAVRKKNAELVRFLLEQGASAYAPNKKGRFIYQQALIEKDLPVFEELIRFYPELERLFVQHNLGLFYKARMQSTLPAHLDETDPRYRETPLTVAVEADDYILVEALLMAGASPNLAIIFDYQAISRVKSVKMYQLLLSFGTIPTHSDFRKLLYTAVNTGNAELMSELFTLEMTPAFDINQEPDLLYHALRGSIPSEPKSEQNIRIARILLENGMDPLHSGLNILQIPCHQELKQFIQDLIAPSVDSALNQELKHNASISNFKELLHQAVKSANEELVIELFKHEVAESFEIEKNSQLLLEAIWGARAEDNNRKRYINIAVLLLKKGINPLQEGLNFLKMSCPKEVKDLMHEIVKPRLKMSIEAYNLEDLYHLLKKGACVAHVLNFAQEQLQQSLAIYQEKIRLLEENIQDETSNIIDNSRYLPIENEWAQAQSNYLKLVQIASKFEKKFQLREKIGDVKIKKESNSITILSQRLEYHSFNQDDEEVLLKNCHNLLRDKKNTRYFCEGTPFPTEKINQYVISQRTAWNSGNMLNAFSAYEKGKFIGYFDVQFHANRYENVGQGYKNVIEIGYILDNAYWGRGYGMEMAIIAKKYIKHALAEMSLKPEDQPTAIIATVHPENKGSVRILEETLKNQESKTIFAYGNKPRLVFFKPLKPVKFEERNRLINNLSV